MSRNIDAHGVRVFIGEHEIIGFADDQKLEVKMEKKDYQKEIDKKTKEAEEIVSKIKEEIAALADEGGIQAYWGDYGNGETYYPKGTNAEDEYINWHASHLMDQEGILTQGVWISSSEMC